MSRKAARFHGSGANGAWVDRDQFEMDTGFIPFKDTFDLMLLGNLGQRDIPWCGSKVTAIECNASGDVDLIDWMPWEIDNLLNQLSDFTDPHSATLVVAVRFHLRVSDASISLTPKIYNITLAADATIAGASACSTTSDLYTGVNQDQLITLTLPANAKHKFKPRVTRGGTVAEGKHGWARTTYGLYIQST